MLLSTRLHRTTCTSTSYTSLYLPMPASLFLLPSGPRSPLE